MNINNNREVVSNWIAQIGSDRECALSLQEDGHCIIPFADDLDCIVEVPNTDSVNAVFIYIPLALLPEQPEAQLMVANKALRMNLFGLITGGCHLGIDERSNYVVLSFSALVDVMDETVFKLLLTDMFNVAADLRQRLQDCVG